MGVQIYLLTFIVYSYLSTVDGCKGCITLGDLTFDKVIPKFDAVLVKFDTAFPYGDKHETFSKFSEETVGMKDLLFADVGIKDYGEKDNENLAKRYGITKDDYPAVRLFKKDVKKPIVFSKNTEFTIDNLRSFVRDNTDIYIGLPGCLEKYDKLAAEFLESKEKKKVLNQAEKLSDSLHEEEKKSAKMYILLMKKVIENGKKFLSQESERVSKLLQEKITANKKSELQSKLNIIRAFTIPRKDEL